MLWGIFDENEKHFTVRNALETFPNEELALEYLHGDYLPEDHLIVEEITEDNGNVI